MKNIINAICLPIVLFGAINYGLIGLFDLDILAYLGDPTLMKVAHVVIGLAGVGLATGWYGKK
ncbi:MAG: DUF378 domain-containing protein [Rickettsiales bacterium]|jgi:uncharacterized membrane protein YuzA (DUF378 family)|nr:DUF378 domain-containing protein [Rickettsiales bacterium]